MGVRSVLNIFNRCFLICGGGSISYNQSKLKTTMIFHILRSTIVYCGLKSFYIGNYYWGKIIDPDMFEVTSLVMIICYELMLIGPVFFNVWRLFFDNKLSVVLTKLEGIHDKLIHLNVVRPMKIKINWLSIFGVLVHFIAFNMFWIYFILNRYSYINMIKVTGWITIICECVAFYEYILLISYIKWMVYTINQQIPKNISTISTFRDLYLEVIECLNDINRSIYGLPVIVSFIASNVGLIIFLLFYKVIFNENDDTKNINKVIIDIISSITRIVNIILLYGIGHATAKEINRMNLFLRQRFIIEKNPRIKRQIKFFMLRRCHEHYHFELCGICAINLRKLFFLLNKAVAYLIIQILFKLNKASN